jgi:hypothetical protein
MRLVLPLGPAEAQWLTVIDKDAAGQTRTRETIPVASAFLRPSSERKTFRPDSALHSISLDGVVGPRSPASK